MRKHLLLTIAGLVSALAMNAQSLINTTWVFYYPEETVFRYMYFTDDTLHWSPDNVTYSAHSVIAFNGDAMQITDLVGADIACPVGDVGQYTFEIVGDTLEFTLVSDPCAPRAATLDGGYGLQLVSGIDASMLDPAITVFPNPAPDGRFHLRFHNTGNTYKTLQVCTMDGRMVLQRSLPTNTLVDEEVQIGDQAEGMYLMMLEGAHKATTVKLIFRSRE